MYLGGESYIDTLDTWIDDGQQRILITGDSGSEKVQIANWMAAHRRAYPDDVVTPIIWAAATMPVQFSHCLRG